MQYGTRISALTRLSAVRLLSQLLVRTRRGFTPPLIRTIRS
jgi:hypothetical protein